jgi:hypothetical protein
MVQAKVVFNDSFEQRCEYYQRICLGGGIKCQDDINARLDTAEENFMNSCWKCFMKGRKTHGTCDTDQCPIKVMHRKVVKILLNLSDIIEEKPSVKLPYVNASDWGLEQLVWFWESFIKTQLRDQ